MKAVQILMDEDLIEAVDNEARQQGTDRSKLVRTAIANLLAEMRRRRLEEQHRNGYVHHPQSKEEVVPWEEIQEWPEN